MKSGRDISRSSRRAYFASIYLDKLVGSLVWEPTDICMCTCSLDLEGLAKDRKVDSTHSGFRSILVPFTSLKGLYSVVRLPRKFESAMLNAVVQFR